jgi:hypothetical protein
VDSLHTSRHSGIRPQPGLADTSRDWTLMEIRAFKDNHGDWWFELDPGRYSHGFSYEAAIYDREYGRRYDVFTALIDQTREEVEKRYGPLSAICYHSVTARGLTTHATLELDPRELVWATL